VAGVIESIKIKRTRKGDKMATLRVEDLTGSTEVVVFPDVFNKTSHLFKDDEPLLIEGSAEISENTSKILAQEIITLSSIREKAVKAIELNLRQHDISKELLEDLRSIIFRFPGKCRLIFRVNGSNGNDFVIAANDCYSVLPCSELIDELETMTGDKIKKIGVA
jgi:DNA polymerase-3 subunit alpha